MRLCGCKLDCVSATEFGEDRILASESLTLTSVAHITCVIGCKCAFTFSSMELVSSSGGLDVKTEVAGLSLHDGHAIA